LGLDLRFGSLQIYKRKRVYRFFNRCNFYSDW